MTLPAQNSDLVLGTCTSMQLKLQRLGSSRLATAFDASLLGTLAPLNPYSNSSAAYLMQVTILSASCPSYEHGQQAATHKRDYDSTQWA
jgi:hypothetical protein